MSTILVVDDRAVNRNFLVTLLGYSKHRILQATDGAVALKIAKEDHPDLIITDILMPVMSGYELVKHLQEDPTLATIPVIFYTATYRLEDAAVIAIGCGVKEILSKPSEPQLILNTVNKILNESKTEEKIAEEKYEAKDTQDNGEEKPNKQINTRMLTLFEFNMDLSPERDPQKLLKLFTNGSCKIMRSEYCGLVIFDEVTKEPKYYFLSNNGASVEVSKNSFSISNPLASDILKADGVFRIHHLEGKVAAELPPNHPTLQSLIGTAIRSANYEYGFFYFVDKTDKSLFNDVDAELVSSLANQISTLYENVELSNKVKEQELSRERPRPRT